MLLVTKVALKDMACAAISVSSGPMGVPFFSNAARILPYTPAASLSKERICNGLQASINNRALNEGFELFCTPYSSSAKVIAEIFPMADSFVE